MSSVGTASSKDKMRTNKEDTDEDEEMKTVVNNDAQDETKKRDDSKKYFRVVVLFLARLRVLLWVREDHLVTSILRTGHSGIQESRRLFGMLYYSNNNTICITTTLFGRR